MTKEGMALEGDEYESILYVSKDRLEELRTKLKDGKEVTKEDIEGLVEPEDLGKDALLTPVDVGDAGEGFPATTDHEEILEKIGPKEAAEGILKASVKWETTKQKFNDEERPIAMTVGDWLKELENYEILEDEGGEEESLVDESDEEEDEDDAKEEEEEDEDEGPASKKQKTA